MKRPAHMTLVDADRYSALVTRCTEQRERALRAEARIEELESAAHDVVADLRKTRFTNHYAAYAYTDAVDLDSVQRLAALAKERP